MKIEIDLTKKKYPSFNDLIQQLIEMGYQRVSMVIEPGDLAVRGSIIDVFAQNHSHPIRFEYFDDDIDRLCSFESSNQRSIQSLKTTNIHSFIRTKQSAFFSWQETVVQDRLLSDFKLNSYVVHEDYGIGQFKGLIRLTYAGGKEGEFLWVQYKGKDKLYVPLTQLDRVHAYVGSERGPKLNHLNDGSWRRIKSRVKKAAQELVEDVYLMEKLRQAKQGYAFNEDNVWQIDLEKTFPYSDTPDQFSATCDIKRDMESYQPMDRLVCGDVGYGKTELMIRAAFKAIQDKKQVVVLTPTTILAKQHYQTFCERLKKYPCRVDFLSRFKSKKEQVDVIKRIKNHQIDIIIGTHRLLQKDIKVSDVGLLIIDEEQRFGVQHKDRFKQFQSNIDVLSVTATPIPRTLFMALSGSKAISKLETPPIKRKPVLTKVAPYSDELVVSAIQKEIDRGGQVFYVHNRVNSIQKQYNQLKKILPGVSIAIGHGQMKETALEAVMDQFSSQEIDVLVCTTIIENGIDIPTANTIIFNNVDQLGLSQIHQLRGRVGRTDQQGYAYLLYDERKPLTQKAKDRLKTIYDYATLGAGYKIALKDLELRGAGAVLGYKQHGHMISVGFDLYCKLLSEHAHQRKPSNKLTPSFQFDLSQFVISNEIVSSERERLAIYQRLVNISTKDEFDILQSEVKDRYGLNI